VFFSTNFPRSSNWRSVDALLLALKDQNHDVPLYTAEALGRMSDTALVIGLAHALSYKNSFVRQKAAQVAGYYTTDPATAGLLCSTWPPMTQQKKCAPPPATPLDKTAP
jgi:hypothetical protein